MIRKLDLRFWVTGDDFWLENNYRSARENNLDMCVSEKDHKFTVNHVRDCIPWPSVIVCERCGMVR